jgi:poly[(R)-3-hydroxyalkanoate] polymerase subunit PhaE
VDPAVWQRFDDTATAEPPSDIWTAGLLRWWETTPSPTSGEAQKFFRQIVELGRPYFSIGQQLADEVEGSNVEHWLDELNREYASFAERASNQAEQSVRELLAFWEASLNHWRRMAIGPGDATAPNVSGPFDPLAIPAVGYVREWQEQYRHLGDAARTYIERLRDYNGGFVRVAIRSVDKLREKFTSDAGRVTELRGLYEFWVEACEAAYAEYFMSPEYAALYGRLVNALAALRREISALVDNVLQAANLPTRRDLDALARRMHDTRRELALLRDALARAEQSTRSSRSPARSRATPKKPS